MAMTGYLNESTADKCPTKDYLPFLQWVLDVLNLVKILCNLTKHKKRVTIAFQMVNYKSQAFLSNQARQNISVNERQWLMSFYVNL